MSGVGRLFSEVVLGGVSRQGWWLVVDELEGPGRIVAGPFADRAEAGWAAPTHVGAGPVRLVFGIRRPDGVLNRRPSPEDWAWLAHLGEQLARMPDEWDEDLPDDDPLATLLVEVAAALTETGLPLHDAAGDSGEIGGACLALEPAAGGIVVTWRQHDRMSLDLIHGTDADAAVQEVMNRALADLLLVRGFDVRPFGEGSASVVHLGG